MDIVIWDKNQELGRAAAEAGAEILRNTLREKGEAAIILATGVSQFDMLSNLAKAPDIAWENVTAFHLDEYIGLPETHPASFRHYLSERFATLLPVPPKAFHYIQGDRDPAGECARLKALITDCTIALAFSGIGVNGHLAFNDPPADFDTEEPFLTVRLDDACRHQQLSEGWFSTIEEVPEYAISMSIRQILKSEAILCLAPGERKAKVVRDTLEGPITPLVPASILQNHPQTTLYLNEASASLLTTGIK